MRLNLWPRISAVSWHPFASDYPGWEGGTRLPTVAGVAIKSGKPAGSVPGVEPTSAPSSVHVVAAYQAKTGIVIGAVER